MQYFSFNCIVIINQLFIIINDWWKVWLCVHSLLYTTPCRVWQTDGWICHNKQYRALHASRHADAR